MGDWIGAAGWWLAAAWYAAAAVVLWVDGRRPGSRLAAALRRPPEDADVVVAWAVSPALAVVAAAEGLVALGGLALHRGHS